MPANAAFSIWDAQLFTPPSGIVAGETIHLATSPEQPNLYDYPGMQLTVQYRNVVPNLGQYRISAVIEAKDDLGRWHRIGHQNSPFFRDTEGPDREIYVQPDLLNVDPGIDEIVYVGEQTTSMISRHQGRLPAGEPFRVCLILVDHDVGGPLAFQSVEVSAFGEVFTA